ncbi:MAG: hypothetical protein ACSHX9_02880 [Luteolibacter sp.]
MALLLPLVSVENRFGMTMWLVAFRYGSWLLLFLTVAHVVLLDAPARDSAFFRTLPISFPKWLRSKLLFCLVLISPMAVVQGVMIIALGIAPGLIGLVLLFAEDFLAHALVAGLAVTMAARKPNHAKFYASVMICVGVIIAGMFISAAVQEQMHSARKVEWSYSSQFLTQSRFIVVQVLAFVGLLAGLILFSRSRNIWTLGMGLLGILLVSVLTMKFWPVNFVEMMAKSEAEAPRSEWPDVDQMPFEFVETQVGRRNRSMFSSSDGGYNSTTYRTIRVNSELAGLPEGWYAHTNGYKSEIELSDERSIYSSDQAGGALHEETILPELGIPSSRNRRAEINRLTLNIGEFAMPDASGATENAKIRGEVEVPFKRPVILTRIPLKAGESVNVGGSRYQIVSVSQEGDTIRLEILHEYGSISVRGGSKSAFRWKVNFLAINEERRSFLDCGGSGSSGTHVGHYGAQYLKLGMNIWSDWSDDDRTKPKSTGWLDGAELLILGEEYGGKITKKFDFSDISLSNPRGD